MSNKRGLYQAAINDIAERISVITYYCDHHMPTCWLLYSGYAASRPESCHVCSIGKVGKMGHEFIVMAEQARVFAKQRQMRMALLSGQVKRISTY